MKVQTVCHMTIESITDNRSIQSLRGCRVYAQLMGASRLRIEENAGDVARLLHCHDFKSSHSLLAVVEIHLLMGHIL